MVPRLACAGREKARKKNSKILKLKELEIEFESDLFVEDKVVPLVEKMSIEPRSARFEALDRRKMRNEAFTEISFDLPEKCKNFGFTPSF